jgi:hemolysin III
MHKNPPLGRVFYLCSISYKNLKQMEQTKEEEFWNTLTHFIGLLLSLGGLPVLLYYDQSQTALSSYSILFFGFGLILLYAASTVYHFTSNFKLKEKFRVLDHISVFYLIAGSYAPVCLITLYEGKGVSLFLAIIIITLLGTAFKVFYTGKFEKLSLLIYLAMGWLIILDFNTVLTLIEFKGILLMIVGGLFYSIGTIFYSLQKLKYAHAIWHVFVLGGSASHYFLVLLYVI